MRRKFYLTETRPYLPGSRAWTLSGMLQLFGGLVGTTQFMPVTISGASKYDALCILDDRLKMWGVEADDIQTGAFGKGVTP